MKLQICAIAFTLCIIASEALPLGEEQHAEFRALRLKRVTCDLLSAEAIGVALNHSACAAHCLVLGKKGGSCNNGVCHCRN